MEIIPQIFMADVMHKRLTPKVNHFSYSVYYLVLPLTSLQDETLNKHLPISRPGILSFQEKDYGPRDGTDLNKWIRNILSQHRLNELVKNITLVTMPRILGYGFNPVSFWICLDKENQIRAVLCEVNSTFGEIHYYLCAHEDNRPVSQQDWITAQKTFHVSPFMKREGFYKFRFSYSQNKLGVWIDHCNHDHTKQLITSLVGSLQPLTRKNLRIAFWRRPLVSLKAITLIHWQALRLFLKGVTFNLKPDQKKERLTRSTNMSKL